MPPVVTLHGAVTVTMGGLTVLEGAGGVADVRTGSPCTAQTRFQIASISKQLAAVSVLLLAEQGMLRIDQPITGCLPNGPTSWRTITVHHLLTHTSGIGHWSDIPDLTSPRQLDGDRRLALLQRAPLRSAPGRQWHYSSPGYLLIAHIVEQVTGQPYATVLTEQILEPLAMTSTSSGTIPPGIDVASGHHDGRRIPSWDPAAMPGAGDVWSSVGDLARFTTAINTGTLLSPASRQIRVTPHAPVPRRSAVRRPVHGRSYGYAVLIDTIAGHTAYFHPGDNPGYRSFAAWLPDHNTALAVLSNDEITDIDDVVQRVVRAVLPP